MTWSPKFWVTRSYIFFLLFLSDVVDNFDLKKEEILSIAEKLEYTK